MEFNNRWRDLFLVMAFFGTCFSCLTGAIPDAIPDALLLLQDSMSPLPSVSPPCVIVPDLI